MPPNPKPSPSTSTPTTSQPKTLTPPFFSCAGGDDDDDFQSPLEARRARPLKPSNGTASRRPRKKPKPSIAASAGKENCPVAGGTVSKGRVAVAAEAETLGLGSRVCSTVPEERNATGAERCGISGSGLDASQFGIKGKKWSGCGICKGNYHSKSIESGFSGSNAKCDFGGCDCKETQELGSRVRSSVPEERNAATAACITGSDACLASEFEIKEKKWSRFEVSEGNHHLNSIESWLLELKAKCDVGGGDCEETQELGSRVYSSVSEERNAAVEARVASQYEIKEKEWSGFEVCKGDYRLNSIELRLLELNAKCDFGGVDCEEAQELGSRVCNSVSEESNAEAEACVASQFEIKEKNWSVFEVGKGNYHTNSIELRLLESSAKCDFEGDDCDDFEIGTQLNELINLCSEADVEGDLNSRASPLQGNGMDFGMFESECQVECPLCRSDISHLSEELRQMHTNHCLDKNEQAEVITSNCETKSSSGGENVKKRSVVEWLRDMGLSTYEEVFVREEVDWEILQWLTEEDLLSIGITSLGPRKKIIHALSELRKKNDHAQGVEANILNPINAEKTKLSMAGNKLITEYFRGSSIDKKRVCNLSKPSNLKSQISTATRATSGSRVSKGKVKDIPLWCCIPGTSFRVDAFRYLTGDCCHWFLTHFHIDHYQGLTKSFCRGKIYCSSITARLVNHKIGVPWGRLHILPLNQKITIAGVNLTCFDANHCPGSIIILFEPPNGKAVLHTGDFRFSSEMANNPVLQSCHVHTLILDTTYCNPRYDFPNQETVIQFVIEVIQAEAFNPKTLFLIGSYTIGKERLFMEVARLLQKKVYVGAAKLQLLKCLELPEEVMHWFTANEMESHIHVVPMWTLASFKRMKYFSNQYTERFDLIVAFSPTGWTFGKGQKKTPGRRWQQGTIIRYEVPYSEHCSFTELQEFVRFISPEHIIPSVNNDGPESADAMLAQLLIDS